MVPDYDIKPALAQTIGADGVFTENVSIKKQQIIMLALCHALGHPVYYTITQQYLLFM